MEPLPIFEGLTPLVLLALVLFMGWKLGNRFIDIFANHLEKMSDALEEMSDNLQDCLQQNMSTKSSKD